MDPEEQRKQGKERESLRLAIADLAGIANGSASLQFPFVMGISYLWISDPGLEPAYFLFDRKWQMCHFTGCEMAGVPFPVQVDHPTNGQTVPIYSV